jgi:hypothetical protein
MKARALYFLSMLLFSGAAQAEQRRLFQESLPLDGRPVELAVGPDPAGGPVLVMIEGTLTSTYDGSELDALHRREARQGAPGGLQWQVDGPFVRLPPGTRLVEADLGAHRYLFEVPRAPLLSIAVDLAPLAMRHLVTRSEIIASCHGALQMSVFGEPSESLVDEARGGAAAGLSARAPLFGGGLLALLTMIGGARTLRRWRRTPERLLSARARAAAQVLEAEGAALGPAFSHVVGAAGELVQTVQSGQGRLRELREARRRLRRLDAAGARERREALERREAQTLEELHTLTSRLEETAAQLAACRVEQRCAVDTEALSRALKDELDLALTAAEEARATTSPALSDR